MTGSLVTALAAPIREVQALVGPGFSGPDLADALHTVQSGLDGVAADADGAWQQAQNQWTGAASGSAGQFASAAVTAIVAMAMTAGQLGTHTAQAADAVARARDRLQVILQNFEARAAALETGLKTPADAAELIDEASRALDEAISVVDGLHAELATQAEQVTATTTTPLPSSNGSPWAASGLGAGSAPTTSPSLGASAGQGANWANGLGGLSGLGALATPATHAAQAALTNRRQSDPGKFGAGESVTLPDGSTAAAPNRVAADAVRHALTQLGVPYVWGGTTPGVGLDCSGLTQWAYQEAGLDLPRLAQEQDVGATVDRGSLRPGDLAVWDGHVAMIVGNNLMIEAGDPVQLSPIRTTNLDQGFHGFFRPTA
ncbi:NlpC/P60 family protein [Mycobacterium sp. CBMA293]|uniref:C40 family peptidase n=3 Tax=Mycolicibacterium TaxID=1866885 RepID=UPI0012DBF21C|nr:MULTISPECIES: C40 family peptidase [unclassified Mycolicibacterium]MUL46725.1 NlpC/P60 family protein [Mycolicibacterium sp. CBMA 360]MUL57491.1 NlpC/P60 family protein [Mycolicibacterium sp. CBMA 335]MUL70531.1 NlpC/P60 family protein [Mycolicibacterium sp. CBMA 311]MUL92579.1 NlpC/P60 family protein [Mycolicibacterium sp. CBMA 230]MUM04955.1 glycoside hydrolase [Mycolicibacterium sp. CBMA 213]